MKNNILLVVILVLIAGGAGFFGGMKYQESKQPSRADFRSFGQSRGVQGMPRMGGSNAVRGEIIDKDDSSITVKLPDESSKIVFISEDTAINKAAEGSFEDLETGDQVMVFGQTNSDGSVNAQHVQINPEFGRSPDSPQTE